MKIKISKISKKCFLQKGFNEKGCYGCKCDDACCKYGTDFDQESFNLVIQNKDIIEKLIGKKINDCFRKTFSKDSEYLGNNSIRSVKGENGFCIFHSKQGKGCILYQLVRSGKISNRRIIPSVCRLFPLTWDNGKLQVYDEQEGYIIPHDCNCIEKENTTKKNILETQKSEIEDIFDLK